MTEREYLEKWINDYTHDIEILERLDADIVSHVWAKISKYLRQKREEMQKRLDEINANETNKT